MGDSVRFRERHLADVTRYRRGRPSGVSGNACFFLRNQWPSMRHEDDTCPIDEFHVVGNRAQSPRSINI